MGRTTAVQSVVDTLRAEITASHRPGDLLANERALAERFGVGRNTAREALVTLQVHGLIKITRRGPMVTEPDFDAVFSIFSHYFASDLRTCRDLLDMRTMLETGVLPAALANAGPDDVVALSAILDRMDAALTVRENAVADHAFHARIVQMAGNTVIARLYAVMRDPIIFYMEIGKNVPRHDAASMGNHRRMVEAIGRQDLAGLTEAAAAHYAYSRAVLEETLSREAAARNPTQNGSGGQQT